MFKEIYSTVLIFNTNQFNLIEGLCSISLYVLIGKIQLDLFKMRIEIDNKVMISLQYIIFNLFEFRIGQIKATETKFNLCWVSCPKLNKIQFYSEDSHSFQGWVCFNDSVYWTVSGFDKFIKSHDFLVWL